MDSYNNFGESALKRLISGIRSLNVAPHTQPLFYSGPSHQDGLQIRNRLRAENYAAREGATTLEMTERGRSLEAQKDKIVQEASDVVRPSSAILFLRQEWEYTSSRYAQLAQGDVKAFVAGADKKDVFYREELLSLINNPRVTTINGVQRDTFHKIVISSIDGLDRASHLVARAGVRQDIEQALRTGDRELIKDAFTQMQLCVNQMQRDRDEKFNDSQEAYDRRRARLNRRAEKIVAKRQAEIRTEALHEARTSIDKRLQAGSITRETADRIMKRAAQAVQDPQKAYRMRELAQLKRVRNTLISGARNIRSIHDYLNSKEQYQKDMRAVRQANGQRFIASDPIHRQSIRRRYQRLLTGHAHLTHHYRRREINDDKYGEKTGQILHTRLVQVRATRPKLRHRVSDLVARLSA